MLGALGYDAGPVDGVAWPRVSEAVRAFQRDHGQAADGRLTGETMAALRPALHGQLTWHLRNPAADKPALEATLPISQADATALRQSMRACLAVP